MKKYKLFLLLTFCFFSNGILKSQNVEVSTGGPVTNYLTLGEAFIAINAGTHTGTILIEIASNTSEAGPCILNSSGAGSASYSSILIRPRVDGVIISATTTTGRGVIELKGADNVTIDGDNPNTSGTNRNLTIQNTAANTITYTSVIRIANSAAVTSSNNNIFQNLILLGSATGRNGAGFTSTTASENTTFGIYCGGNGGSTATDNPTAITSVTTNSAPNGTTINNLLISNNSVNSCARGIVFIGANATVSDSVKVRNNLVGDQSALVGDPPFTSPATSVYVKGIFISGSTSVYVSDNSVKSIVSYVATIKSGIELSSGIGAGTKLILNNTVEGVVSNGSGANRPIGISITSSPGSYTISGNTVNNIQMMGTSSAAGIEVSTTATSGFIMNNKISKIHNRNTGTYGAYGINLAGGSNLTIQNNFVSDLNHDMSSGGAFSTTFGLFGIRLGVGSNHKFYYNTVHLYGTRFGTPNPDLLSSCFAIISNSQTGLDVRNNIFSNVMTGGTTNIAQTSIFLPTGGTSSMNLLMNNNGYYSSLVTGGGLAQVGTTELNIFPIADFNKNTITPATNLRAYTSTLNTIGENDNMSFATNSAAPFVTDNDLHIPALTATQLESGGVIISGVATDIDGVNRFPNSGYPDNPLTPAVAPDIGADEFAGTIIDLNGPEITYSSLLNTNLLTNRILSNFAEIDDNSGVDVSPGSKPRIYYKKSTDDNVFIGNTSGDNGWKWTKATNSTSPFSFEINYSIVFGGSVSTGNTIQYFIVAQDSAVPANVGSNPSPGFVATSVGSITSAPTVPNQFNLVENPLSGIIIVSSFDYMKMSGRDIRFEERTRKVLRVRNVKKAEFTENNSRTGKPVFNSDKFEKKLIEVDEKYFVPMIGSEEYKGRLGFELNKDQMQSLGYGDVMGSVYPTITSCFEDLNERGIDGSTTIMLANATYPTEVFPLELNIKSEYQPNISDTLYIRPSNGMSTTITGNSAGAAILHLINGRYTVVNGNPTGSESLRFINTSLVAGSSVIKYEVIEEELDSQSRNFKALQFLAFLFLQSSGEPGIGNSELDILTFVLDNHIVNVENVNIQNNIFENGAVGINIEGGDDDLGQPTIQGLNVTGNIMNTIGTDAIKKNGIMFKSVKDLMLQGNIIGNFESATANTDVGITIGENVQDAIIDANSINNISHSGTFGYGGHGIDILSDIPNANVLVSNNQITGIAGDGFEIDPYIYDNPTGIFVGPDQTGVTIANNSIFLNGNTINQTDAISSGIVIMGTTPVTIVNNNIVNNLGRTGAVGIGSTVLYLESPLNILESNYNNFFSDPSGTGSKLIGLVNGVQRTTLPDFRDLNNGNDNLSFSSLPVFTSPTNLDPVSDNTANAFLNGSGIPLPYVGEDLNGDPRPTTIPEGASDIGAFDFDFIGTPPSATPSGPVVVDVDIHFEYFGRRVVTIKLVDSTGMGVLPSSITVIPLLGVEPPNVNTVPGSRFSNGFFQIDMLPPPSGGVKYDLFIYTGENIFGTITDPLNNSAVAKNSAGTWQLFPRGTGNEQTEVFNDVIRDTYEFRVRGIIGNSAFALTDMTAPLPVELSSFNASVNRNDVELRWTTAGEVNNSGFEIERKLISESNWKKISFVDGFGNSTEPKNYLYNDKFLNTGKYNYRLKQIDYNGNFEYFELSSEVVVGVPDKFDLSQNYPNPFNPVTKINYDLPFDSRVMMKVYDITGREVYSLVNEQKPAGYYTTQFNAGSLASGVYFYRLIANGINGQDFVLTKKMMLVK
ncbi:MAG TPA: hypothetical protein PLG90_10045 [Ignavibacteria bacterium]|nr:hypothetical protein [Ignavibacteria bacterium]